jgi:hypothetical protein
LIKDELANNVVRFARPINAEDSIIEKESETGIGLAGLGG